VAVHRRALFVSLGVAVVVSVAGGWLVARSDGGADDDLDVVLDTPGVEQIPSIATNAPVQGDPLPTVDLVDDDGDPISTADLVGTPLVVNVWNSTCAPCRRELPDFAAVHADVGDEVRFVGVNNLDTPEVNLSFARDRGVRYELLRDTQDAFASEVGIAALPVTLFVAPDGTILRQTGVLEEDDLRAIIDELFGSDGETAG
jgi:thiol-disulfide isomerase/thioredoxin